MKSLKEYIAEGILDIENNINIDASEMTKDAIEQFLKYNYNVDNISYTIKNIKHKFIVDIKGDMTVTNKNITSLTNRLFEFGVTSGCFYCNNCESLKSLEGAPEKVCGAFACKGCKSLKSLEDAPKEVWCGFYCSDCDNLKSLEGAPKEVGGDFYCDGCKSLKTLKGAPKKVGGRVDCRRCGTQFTEDDVIKYITVSGNIRL